MRENTELERLALWVIIGALAGPGVIALLILAAAAVNWIFNAI